MPRPVSRANTFRVFGPALAQGMAVSTLHSIITAAGKEIDVQHSHLNPSIWM